MGEKACQKERIAGASFTLCPMSDDFVDVIKGAIGSTDSSAVWLETDDVSTTARGKIIHVFDVTKAICVHAARTGKHVAFQATYAVGCPGNKETDVYMTVENAPKNALAEVEDNSFAAAKFALYPLGDGEYMDIILGQIESIKEYVDVSHAHLSTKLTGGMVDIFKGLEKVFQATIEAGSAHTVMTVSISINSPSHKG